MSLKFRILVSIILLSLPTLSMDNSLNGLSFDTQEDLNRFIGQRSKELYGQLNACSRYPNRQLNELPNIPGECWDVGSLDGNKIVMVKLNNVKASSALEQIFHNHTDNILDCGIARSIVVSKCLQEILGSTLFDIFYEACEEMQERSDRILFFHQFCSLFCIKKNLTTREFFQSGGLVCFKNLPDYLQYNPKQFYSNDNLITVANEDGEVQYMGFGEDYKNGPISYNKVKKYMLAAFNVGYPTNGLPIDQVMSLQNKLFDAIQDVPVSLLSLKFINIAKTEKSLVQFLRKTGQM